MAFDRESFKSGVTNTMTGLGIITFTSVVLLGIGLVSGKVKVSFSRINKEQSKE